MGRLFGTDGVRGVANEELTPELAYKIGRAGAYVLTEQKKHKAKILVGKDTRISGDMLESALIAGICSVGAEAVTVGVIPTPAVAYLTRLYNADAGVVISASHNPMAYNGIKYFNREGYKLSDAIEERIEDIILDEKEKIPSYVGSEIGWRTEASNATRHYIEFAKSTIDIDLKGMKIVVDCANGAGYKAGPAALKELGAEVTVLYDKPDGININANCGSTHIDNLKEYVKSTKADLGIAFDGDADRVLMVDEQGNLVDGDEIMSVCALALKKAGKLKDNAIVVTVMSNLGLFLMAQQKGLKAVQTKVGDRYVLEEMVKKGYTIGGEQSGHVIFLEHNTTGDGLITALQFLKVLKQSGQKVSELSSVMQVLPQVLVNAKVSNGKKYQYMQDDVIVKAIKSVEQAFKDNGRVLIRPSGTEPLVRVMIEGKEKELLQQKAQELATLLEQRLG